MESHEISSGIDLLDWLDGRPSEWVYLLTLRPPLRALAHMVHKGRPSEDYIKRVDFCFRANVLSWIAAVEPKMSIWSSITAAYEIALKLPEVRSYVDDVSFEAAMSAAKAMAIWEVESSTNSSVMFARECVTGSVDFAAMAAVYQFGEQAEQAMWQALQADCLYLENSQSGGLISSDLAVEKIWLSQPYDRWFGIKDFLSESLLAVDPNYSVWIDWYERRIRGERAAFDIPGDKGRIEDKQILRRLAEATDEDFWGKGYEYVNATLKSWLEEARARVAPEIISAEASGVFDISGIAEAELGPLPLPAQNTNALSFRADDEGRITIAGDALASQLRTDAGARDRHEEAVSEARHALGRCQGNNAAARLTGLLTNYLAAAGESVETAKPSLLVQRGERLRQELARYEAPDHMLPPVADDLLLDLKGWQSAHNMMVGLDPVFLGMDTAILGPDRQPTLVPPDEIRQKSKAADEAGILADDVVGVLIEAADLAPDIPDAGNRLTVLSNEMIRNLFIEAFSIALNHPAKTVGGALAGTAIFTALGAGGVGAVSIMGSIKAAEYLVNHRDWILDRLSNTPTWQALIAKLADWLEEVTPFDRK